ncbi:DUF1902 domain-containing protein [Salinarimonas sp.]|uniref:DUF1902 domain-containing protein n=1 Tax=Salinarimonas sp. TaxID=2766526 RepID=UPI0032D926BB
MTARRGWEEPLSKEALRRTGAGSRFAHGPGRGYPDRRSVRSTSHAKPSRPDRGRFRRRSDVRTVEHSAIPGLCREAASHDALIARLPGMVADLIEENGAEGEPISDPRQRGYIP